MTEHAIHLEGVTKLFGLTVAVKDVDLEVRRDELLALLGPSGCGKTTLLRIVAGFERPDTGRVSIGSTLVEAPGVHVPPERRRVGMVFQDYALFPHLDVRANVAFGLARGSERNERIREVLALVGLGQLADRFPHQLSGGQQQRVALARALAPEPEIILLDEPFSNLDSRLRAQVRGEVRQILAAAHASAVFVTHDQEEAFSLADRVGVMWGGQVLQVGTPEEVYRHPSSRDVAAFVGDADFIPGHLEAGHVTCELGRFPVSSRCSAGDGVVEIMLRPEAVLLDDGDTRALVIAREFYGHDQAVTLRLPSGRQVRCRLGPFDDLIPGGEVGVHVEGDVMAYPAGWPAE